MDNIIGYPTVTVNLVLVEYMTQKLIPERLKTAREKTGMSMAEASRQLSLSKIGYCRYEYGERTPSIQTIEVIARCFNTSVEYLTGQTEDISPDYVIINKNSEPELYNLAEIYSKDPEIAERINKLIKELTRDK